jgi:hypothetical protein
MERVAVDFWRSPGRERSADIRSDLGQASNAGQCQKRRNPPGASHCSVSTVSYEFSRLFFHCCFSVKLRRGSAHLEASDGCHHKDRFSQRRVCLEGYRWRCSDDDLVLSHARITAAIRSELSLSIPRFERDLHHANGSANPQGKAKYATSGWRITDQRRNSSGFNELGTPRIGGRSSCDAGLAELAPPEIIRRRAVAKAFPRLLN